MADAPNLDAVDRRLARDDGGPAFPRDEYYDERRYAQTDGMSLRDYFAAAAINHMPLDMADRIAAPDAPTWDEVHDDERLTNEYIAPAVEIARRLAVAGYLIADAMLAERAK